MIDSVYRKDKIYDPKSRKVHIYIYIYIFLFFFGKVWETLVFGALEVPPAIWEKLFLKKI